MDIHSGWDECRIRSKLCPSTLAQFEPRTESCSSSCVFEYSCVFERQRQWHLTFAAVYLCCCFSILFVLHTRTSACLSCHAFVCGNAATVHWGGIYSMSVLTPAWPALPAHLPGQLQWPRVTATATANSQLTSDPQSCKMMSDFKSHQRAAVH